MSTSLTPYRFIGDKVLWTSLIVLQAESHLEKLSEKLGEQLQFIQINLSQNRNGEAVAAIDINITNRSPIHYSLLRKNTLTALDDAFHYVECKIMHSITSRH